MQDVPTADASPDQRLAALREKVRADLDVIAHPRMEWLSPRKAPDGTKALDVLIVGAGQSGIATAFGLKRARVDQLCLECHSLFDGATLGSQPPSFHDLRSPRYQNCTTCHVMVHGSNASPLLLK